MLNKFKSKALPEFMIPIKTLFLATRPQYLLLSLLLVCLGGSIAHYYGPFSWHLFWLCLIGLVLLHVSTNLLNDYFDFSSGIDKETVRTPFNGGSGFLNEGVLLPQQTFLLGISAFILAIPIGGYLINKIGWSLLPLFLLGSAFVLFNSSHITRLGWGLGELSAGLGLGALPVYGTAWILHGNPSLEFIFVAVPSALWVFNLLLLNEFPDEWADRRGGRKTLVIQLGFRWAWWVYTGFNVMAYLWIVASVWAGAMPRPCLLVFLALPLTLKAISLSRKPDFGGDFTKAQATNVALTLAGHGLLVLGYWVAAF